LQVYNPAGFSIEFAMVRSSPQRLDWVLSIVVWCGVLPHHQSTNKKPTQVGFLLTGLDQTSGADQ
jgi:hypothetical protein